jgi:hypothetical protein
MIAEISSLITSSKAAYDIAKGISALKSEVGKDEAISKILEVLISVQTEALSVNTIAQKLQQENYDLKSKILEYENWSETEQQYELKEVAPGTFIYSYKQSQDKTKPDHWLCPKCFQEKKTHILQLHYEGSAGPSEYICSNCNTVIKIRTKSPGFLPSGGRTNRGNFM